LLGSKSPGDLFEELSGLAMLGGKQPDELLAFDCLVEEYCCLLREVVTSAAEIEEFLEELPRHHLSSELNKFRIDCQQPRNLVCVLEVAKDNYLDNGRQQKDLRIIIHCRSEQIKGRRKQRFPVFLRTLRAHVHEERTNRTLQLAVEALPDLGQDLFRVRLEVRQLQSGGLDDSTYFEVIQISICDRIMRVAHSLREN
jgi:hypothetical protein